MDVYPLIFEPILKPKIWGGRKLETLFGKCLPGGAAIGESWELADLEDDQSVVVQGPAKDKTLGALVTEWGTDLIGRAKLFENRFPLLIKFLDADQMLSVQVHPDPSTARRIGGTVRVKNEAWYVLEAEADAFIYRGLRGGIDAAALERAIAEDRVESVLQRLPVKKGHCYYLPSGTIHALGTGVVVAEIQTPSDTTYRVYDWNRIDSSTGRARDLHVHEALPCVSFDPVPPETEQPQHIASLWTSVTSLVRCESFIIERIRMIEGMEQEIPYEEMVIWMVLEGRGQIECSAGDSPFTFGVGDTVLLPAGLSHGRVKTLEECLWLEVTLPIVSSLAPYERPGREQRHAQAQSGAGFVSISTPRPPKGRLGGGIDSQTPPPPRGRLGGGVNSAIILPNRTTKAQ